MLIKTVFSLKNIHNQINLDWINSKCWNNSIYSSSRRWRICLKLTHCLTLRLWVVDLKTVSSSRGKSHISGSCEGSKVLSSTLDLGSTQYPGQYSVPGGYSIPREYSVPWAVLCTQWVPSTWGILSTLYPGEYSIPSVRCCWLGLKKNPLKPTIIKM